MGLQIVWGKSEPDFELMSRPEWRNIQRRHSETLAGRLHTRGDWLRLVRDFDEGEKGAFAQRGRLTPESLAFLIGRPVRVAALILDSSRSLDEEIRLTSDQKLEAIATWGTVPWR